MNEAAEIAHGSKTRPLGCRGASCVAFGYCRALANIHRTSRLKPQPFHQIKFRCNAVTNQLELDAPALNRNWQFVEGFRPKRARRLTCQKGASPSAPVMFKPGQRQVADDVSFRPRYLDGPGDYLIQRRLILLLQQRNQLMSNPIP